MITTSCDMLSYILIQDDCGCLFLHCVKSFFKKYSVILKKDSSLFELITITD